jgi:PPOX class probable F420-dependent enzyme
MSVVPESHIDLLERPLYAHLATIRPDGRPQVNPMWFAWDGEHILFTDTTVRQKYKNVTAHPEVAMSINDPDQPYPSDLAPVLRVGAAAVASAGTITSWPRATAVATVSATPCAVDSPHWPTTTEIEWQALHSVRSSPVPVYRRKLDGSGPD